MSGRDSITLQERRIASVWGLEPRSSSSSAEHGKDLHRREGSSAAKAALSDLQQDLKRLERKTERLRDASETSISANEQRSELSVPLDSLQSGVGVLRDASRSRFESIESRLDALESVSAAISAGIEKLQKPQPSREVVDEAAVWGRAEASKVMDVESQYAEERPARARSRSPPRSVRYRSASPESDTAKRRRAIAPYHDDSPARPIEPSYGDEASQWRFRMPDWASAEVQSDPLPLPEARDLMSVVEAIRSSYRNKALGKPIRISVVAQELSKIDGDIYRRYGVAQFKFFVPIAQQYIAMFVERSPKPWHPPGEEHLFVKDLAKPWNSRSVKPPSFDVQVKQLGKQLNRDPPVPPPRETRPEPEPDHRLAQPAKRQLSSVAPRLMAPALEAIRSAVVATLPPRIEPDLERDRPFPPLPQPLSPEWEQRFSEPSTYYPFVEILRELVTPDNQVDRTALHRAMYLRLGNKHYGDMLSACNGMLVFFGVAARLVNISHARLKRNCIIFRDPKHPFYDEQHNKDFFDYIGRKSTR